MLFILVLLNSIHKELIVGVVILIVDCIVLYLFVDGPYGSALAVLVHVDLDKLFLASLEE